MRRFVEGVDRGLTLGRDLTTRLAEGPRDPRFRYRIRRRTATPRGHNAEEFPMSEITGFGWFVIITATLFLLAAIRTFGL
jgi:hypothetical protein